MISGIKRKTTAVEGTTRYFQTVDLIISHFKREADKEKILELINEDSTFEDLLIATAAIHIYHNLGLRVNENLNLEEGTIQSTRNLELGEKKILSEEIKHLLNNSIHLEIDMLNRIINLEEKFLEILIYERDDNFQEIEKEEFIKNIGKFIEREILEIILKYPPYYFYDFIGELIGLPNEIKNQILEDSSGLKELSVELERKLQIEEKEDIYIELSTLNRIINRVKEEFEFKSYHELKMQAMPVRMIKKKIIRYDLDRYPISLNGLKSFKRANVLKRNIFDKIEEALQERINYEEFEREILHYMKNEIIKELNTNPNDFIYFLQNLNESKFEEIIYKFNKYGIYNILNIIGLNSDIVKKVKKNMIRYNIKKFDIIQLNDKKKNLDYRVKRFLNDLEYLELKNIINDKSINEDNEFRLSNFLSHEKNRFKELWSYIEDKIGITYINLKDFERKKQIIDKIFLNQLSLNSYSQILFIMDFNEIMDNLVKDSFFYLLSKILRQLSRIIESYLKVANERPLFLMALKKMMNTTESEEWVWIKIEELLIQRIVSRQEELVILYNAENQPFLINGFILARLTNRSLKYCISKYENEESPLYEKIKPLILKKDLISSISYCLGFDLIKRFEQMESLRHKEKKKLKEEKHKKQDEKKKKIREKQKNNTLNWIERRITSSLMRINSTGINPNQLYWQEKDTKITADNIKLHSEQEGFPLDLMSDYFNFTIEKIKSLYPDLKLPSQEKIKSLTKKIVEKTLTERLKHQPDKTEIENMLDGERYQISKEIASKIGRILDKALYTKFKNNRRR
ncbi:MAG: hypothetical protein GF317_01965 [Candidatus Lokiarchaeota archaeon]|nr:hypothetical protein [Candidatus Lokiarchaeota archaeon]MBD3198707.1 hypothetical protein [Candidatus Lokiarchaeota archaeon]